MLRLPDPEPKKDILNFSFPNFKTYKHMKKVLFVFVAGIIVAVMACTTKTAVVNNDALIDSLNAACAAVWNSGNAETAANFYAEDAIMTFQDNVTVSGRDSLLTFCKVAAGYVKNMKIYRGTYAVVEDLITETGLYTFDWVADDQTVYPNRGSYMMYWKKTPENKWVPVMQINHQANVVVK
jgi:ketosteroid isomerase-like protein